MIQAFLLAIVLYVPGLRPIQYDVHTFWTVDQCTTAAMQLANSEILSDDYDIWCYEIDVQDGYASWENQ